MTTGVNTGVRRGLGAALTVAALLLAGCAAPAPPTVEELIDPAARGAEWQAEHFSQLYEQQVTWARCDENYGADPATVAELVSVGFAENSIQCAMIAAPLDWDDPSNTQTIELAVVHVASPGSPRGTLLGNPGGPGEPGVEFMLGMVLSPGFDGVLASYDLLGFDPRGIGHSTPIACDDAGSELRAVQIAHCAAENSLVHTMGTAQVARDMELMRHLMGEERLDYLGYSYGTMLGATYASIFPERVGRMVLDSAENAEWASPIHQFDQQVAISNSLAALADTCRTVYADVVEVCPFTSESSLIKVLADLDKAPLVASDATTVSGGDLYGILVSTLYQSHVGRGDMLDTIALALFGNQDAIDVLAEQLADNGVEDLSMDIVTCHSYPIEPNIEGLIEHIDQEGVPRLMGGPAVTDEVLAPYVDMSCYALPESGLDYSDTFSAETADPILVVGITGDHATPFQYAQVLADELGNATLLTLDGQGHAASFTGRSSCVDTAVTDYLVDGTIPKAGSVCTDDFGAGD